MHAPSSRLCGLYLLLSLATTTLSAAGLRVAPCTGDATEAWSLARGGPTTVANSGQCLGTLSCAPAAGDAVAMLPCAAPACPNGADLRWTLDSGGHLVSGAAPSLCLTLAAGDGPDVNLWGCAGAASNALWNWTGPAVGPGSGTLNTLDAAAGLQCLQFSGGPGSVAILNASALGRKNYGVGGLAAIGGARLIYEYPEPTRTQILDLLFNPAGGTYFQVLKTEIEGDVDSSYGSGPSFQHNRGEATSFKRGIYLPWLLGEAKKRNPAVGTYSLAWGTPAWVGNGTYLSAEGVDYHIAYLKGVKQEYGLEFDLTGVHNERNWGMNWTIQLRAALDAAGLQGTRISVGDGANSGCTDCPKAWGDSITTVRGD